MNKLLLLILTGCYLFEQTSAQTGATGIGTTSPHSSAILDINSNNKGVLLPRITSAQRKSIVNPAAGLMAYDTDKRTIFMFDGAQWQPMMIAGPSVTTPPETVMPDDLQNTDLFGSSVDISGNYAIIGASSTGNDVGSAYIYFRNGGVWTQQAKLSAYDGAENDYFGTSVAISGDYAVVGAWGDDVISGTPPFIFNHENRGSIYIFLRSGTTWTLQTKLLSTTVAASVGYGMSVAMNGNRLAVGAYTEMGSGAAYIYERSGSIWVLQQRIVQVDGEVDDYFGKSIDISGNYVIVGAPGDSYNGVQGVGSTSIFFNNGIAWSLQKKLQIPGTQAKLMGTSVSISDTLVMIGCPRTDVDGIDRYGTVMALRHYGIDWNFQIEIVVPDGIMNGDVGTSVAIHGEYAIIGAPGGIGNFAGNGTSYLYKYTGGEWQLQRKISDPSPLNCSFGKAVAIDAFNVLIGAVSKSHNKGGAAFLNIE